MNGTSRWLKVRAHLHTQSGICGLTGPIGHRKAVSLALDCFRQWVASILKEEECQLSTRSVEIYQPSFLILVSVALKWVTQIRPPTVCSVGPYWLMTSHKWPATSSGLGGQWGRVNHKLSRLFRKCRCWQQRSSCFLSRSCVLQRDIPQR